MNKSESIYSLLKRNHLIALLTPKSVEQCVVAYKILNPYGVVLEIAFRSEFAHDGIKAILKEYPEALVLAGTVMTRDQAEAAIQAGVAGVVSADYIPFVVETCIRNDVMCIPGGLSDAGKQLVQKAELYGCDLDELKDKYPYQWIYKLFPAVTGNGSNVEIARAWKGPYKDLSIVYTGGVTVDNLSQLYRSDPEGIFCGSALTRSIDEPDKMKEEIEHWMSIVTKSIEKRATTVQPKRSEKNVEAKVVTFGEIMLRLSPPDNLKFIQTKSYDAVFGGAEANVAVSLANYGLKSCFVTALPDQEIGQAAVNALRTFGVNTEYILRQGRRVGIYYLEYGASQRPSKVIYDRAGSSISEIMPGQIDWEEILKDAAWFHWSGITPALSDNAAEVTLEALKAAKNYGITVSVDLNYRSKLWSKEKACFVMTDLMEYVDVCIGNEEDAENIFGIKACSTDVDSGQLDETAYEDVAGQLVKRFGFSKVAITLRQSINASDNVWSACLYNGNEFLQSRKYNIHIIDRVGGGDAFSSGLIYGIISGKPDQDALEFGVAASCLKQTIHGDFNLIAIQEVDKLVSGVGSGRVQR
ncbi:MAG: KHG/KDPG aldolase/sugar kinase fusion protein [Candidatus Hatepunaea meridiana]|nr:KHG/KDPG aldolase/sugar kinase fusion protein [Candidatus Hatepunaea meridiana]